MNSNKYNNFWYGKFIEHIKNIYLTKIIFYKLFFFIIIGFLVLFSSFSLRELVLNASEKSWTLIPNFIDMNLEFNKGIAFSGLSQTSSSVVYLVQSIPLVFGMVIFLFSKNIYVDIPIIFLIFGGLCNVIDRSVVDYAQSDMSYNEHTVVDYFQFTGGLITNSAIFNMPDVYVIFGVILLILYLLISFIKDAKNSNNEQAKDKINIIEDKDYARQKN